MIRIRPAVSEDAVGIAMVHVETWRATYAGVLPDEYLVGLSVTRHAASWAGSLTEAKAAHRIFVAEEADAGVVGFASCGRVRERRLRRGDTPDGEIYTLYVLPDYQGLGLGRALLSETFGALDKSGCQGALLWVLEANPSRFFYEAMGGRRVGTRNEPFAGTQVAEVAYGWDRLVVEPARY